MNENFEARHAILFELVTNVPWPDDLEFPEMIFSFCGLFGLKWYDDNGLKVMSATFDPHILELHSLRGVVMSGTPRDVVKAGRILKDLAEERREERRRWHSSSLV